MKVLHQLNIDTIGGVEYLFRNYLLHNSADLEQHLLVTNKRIHAAFRDAVDAKVKSTRYLKYWGKVKIPPAVRPFHFRRVLRQVQPDLVLSWNRISRDWTGGCTALYYDHGGAWNAEVDDERTAELEKSNKILSCSNASRRMLELRWGVNQAIAVIPNPLRPDLDTADIEAKSPPNGRAIRLGTIGRQVPVKGLSIAIHALRRLLDGGLEVELWFAGEGPCQQALKQLAESQGLVQATRFLGGVSDVKGFFQSVDAVLCPSLRDPMPLVAIEAMACGCPVIATQVDGFPEIVRHGETGLCLEPELSVDEYRALAASDGQIPQLVYDPLGDQLREPLSLSPETLAEGISDLFAQPQRFGVLSRSGIALTRSEYDFGRYIDRLDAAVEQAV